MQPYAMWTDDCQGKKDYDGNMVSISTRYWPGPSGGGNDDVQYRDRRIRDEALMALGHRQSHPFY